MSHCNLLVDNLNNYPDYLGFLSECSDLFVCLSGNNATIINSDSLITKIHSIFVDKNSNGMKKEPIINREQKNTIIIRHDYKTAVNFIAKRKSDPNPLLLRMLTSPVLKINSYFEDTLSVLSRLTDCMKTVNFQKYYFESFKSYCLQLSSLKGRISFNDIYLPYILSPYFQFILDASHSLFLSEYYRHNLNLTDSVLKTNSVLEVSSVLMKHGVHPFNKNRLEVFDLVVSFCSFKRKNLSFDVLLNIYNFPEYLGEFIVNNQKLLSQPPVSDDVIDTLIELREMPVID